MGHDHMTHRCSAITARQDTLAGIFLYLKGFAPCRRPPFLRALFLVLCYVCFVLCTLSVLCALLWVFCSVCSLLYTVLCVLFSV